MLKGTSNLPPGKWPNFNVPFVARYNSDTCIDLDTPYIQTTIPIDNRKEKISVNMPKGQATSPSSETHVTLPPRLVTTSSLAVTGQSYFLSSSPTIP